MLEPIKTLGLIHWNLSCTLFIPEPADEGDIWVLCGVFDVGHHLPAVAVQVRGPGSLFDMVCCFLKLILVNMCLHVHINFSFCCPHVQVYEITGFQNYIFFHFGVCYIFYLCFTNYKSELVFFFFIQSVNLS